MNLGSVQFEENDSQNIAGNKTAEEQFLGNWLHIFDNCRQKFLHGAVFQIIG